ncbi:MAG: hypothetical protein DYG83_18180 [Candidatus Brocadia sp. AMX2]|uniref:Uncharacterized protein n=1 Tax=Candidatus Brocadia sinica JPN1 TaxID=1197129 RepID=A0ABQ0K219_9BACT|nr:MULTISPECIES: hypothetical protein [Brocadia]KXK27702.1 MAG: hypothetical protein UZ01_02989 [Candidatus Brocadia sinica]MBC6934149.1 hypothetical protein [Candidatus Brocadia sp.]MBL1170738.1 hypothetical protein [Candidatus Brocadia sp. AMX1]NOG42881.1 hypothetical protein [Planctomycetota bacterium]KAA0241185.1 MAG: hypothetical protein EDM70_18605 [Candidatus Brocadia sp. AMX2]
MIKDKMLLEKFEWDLIKRNKPDYQRNMEIFEGMYKEAVYLKALPAKYPLEGIQVDIKIARVINSV